MGYKTVELRLSTFRTFRVAIRSGKQCFVALLPGQIDDVGCSFVSEAGSWGRSNSISCFEETVTTLRKYFTQPFLNNTLWSICINQTSPFRDSRIRVFHFQRDAVVGLQCLNTVCGFLARPPNDGTALIAISKLNKFWRPMEKVGC